MIKQGVGIEAWTTFLVGFIPLLVFAASFINKKAYWEITRIDVLCGSLSIVGLILWQITKVGNVAIMFSILADAFASYLTIHKSFVEPESESHIAYTLGIVSMIFTLLVITEWNFENYAFPLYIFIVDSIIAFLIISKIGPKLQKQFAKAK